MKSILCWAATWRTVQRWRGVFWNAVWTPHLSHFCYLKWYLHTLIHLKGIKKAMPALKLLNVFLTSCFLRVLFYQKLIAKERKRNSSKRKMEVASSSTFSSAIGSFCIQFYFPISFAVPQTLLDGQHFSSHLQCLSCLSRSESYIFTFASQWNFVITP